MRSVRSQAVPCASPMVPWVQAIEGQFLPQAYPQDQWLEKSWRPTVLLSEHLSERITFISPALANVTGLALLWHNQ